MRIRAEKIRTVNQPTQTTCDLTSPIRVDRRPRWRKVVSRWLRWAWDALRPMEPTPDDSVEGTLVAFLKWENGRPIYDPFPVDADAAIDFDKPLILVLEGGQIWHTSPVSMVMLGPDGLPSTVETKSSEYRIVWVDKPLIQEPASAR